MAYAVFLMFAASSNRRQNPAVFDPPLPQRVVWKPFSEFKSRRLFDRLSREGLGARYDVVTAEVGITAAT